MTVIPARRLRQADFFINTEKFQNNLDGDGYKKVFKFYNNLDKANPERDLEKYLETDQLCQLEDVEGKVDQKKTTIYGLKSNISYLKSKNTFFSRIKNRQIIKSSIKESCLETSSLLNKINSHALLILSSLGAIFSFAYVTPALLVMGAFAISSYVLNKIGKRISIRKTKGEKIKELTVKLKKTEKNLEKNSIDNTIKRFFIKRMKFYQKNYISYLDKEIEIEERKAYSYINFDTNRITDQEQFSRSRANIHYELENARKIYKLADGRFKKIVGEKIKRHSQLLDNLYQR